MNWHFREFEDKLAEVRKRAHDTAEEVEQMKAKVRKLTNLHTIVPAVVSRLQRTEGKVANIAENQGFRPHFPNLQNLISYIFQLTRTCDNYAFPGIFGTPYEVYLLNAQVKIREEVDDLGHQISKICLIMSGPGS